MNFKQNIVMQLPMLVLIIALVSICTVSTLKLPDLSSLWNKIQNGNETTTNTTKIDNTTNQINSTTVAIPSLRIDDTATFNPDDILNHNKNKTSIIDKIDIKKTITIDEARKLFDGKNLPVIPINGTKLPTTNEIPKQQQVPHNLTKEPESIDLATRKLFEREDYGPSIKLNTTNITTNSTNTTLKKIT